jgi:hypothetical protein
MHKKLQRVDPGWNMHFGLTVRSRDVEGTLDWDIKHQSRNQAEEALDGLDVESKIRGQGDDVGRDGNRYSHILAAWSPRDQGRASNQINNGENGQDQSPWKIGWSPHFGRLGLASREAAPRRVKGAL